MRAFVVVPVCLFLSLAANATEMHKKATKSDKGPTDLTKTIAPLIKEVDDALKAVSGGK